MGPDGETNWIQVPILLRASDIKYQALCSSANQVHVSRIIKLIIVRITPRADSHCSSAGNARNAPVAVHNIDAIDHSSVGLVCTLSYIHEQSVEH